MNKIVGFSNKERNELFFEAASKMGVAPVIIEKDFWVTWILGKIFKDPILSNIFIFKGGTSLSKVFHIIERFSEDIDLILDWSLVTKENPLIERSKTKQDIFNKEINKNAQIYIDNKILHQEAHRPEGKIQPARYSRHYYDLARLAESPIKNIALKHIEMLETVANFKQKFYPCNWAYYHTALPKTLKLIPEDRVLYSLEKDYKKMHPMFFGKYPKFEYIIKTIQSLENEINNM